MENQKNFEDRLFNDEPVDSQKVERQFNCPLCEDSGACTCERGRQWLKENQEKDFPREKKKKKKAA